MTDLTLLSPDEVAQKLNMSTRYFRNVVMKRALVEGVHYIRPFSGRKILLIWERVEEEILRDLVDVQIQPKSEKPAGIPMAGGGLLNV